jgi:hypothetical protein
MAATVNQLHDVDPSSAFEGLVAAGLFPAGETWWFAWCEAELRIPQSLADRQSPFAPHWDHVQVFSPLAELRCVRAGRKKIVLLLIEDENQQKVEMPGIAIEATPYPHVRDGTHILLGERMRVFEDGLAREVRGKAGIPRRLDYLSDQDQPSFACVVGVKTYYDAQSQLAIVRYARLVPQNNWRDYPVPLLSEAESLIESQR